METRLKCKVVMLPTEKATRGGILFDTCIKKLEICKEPNYPYQILKPQHLYFTSKREIKVGDWAMHVEPLRETKYALIKCIEGNRISIQEYCRKLEATTDISLDIPPIPYSFLIVYVEKQGAIDEVEIEMTTFSSCDGTESISVPKLRADGTVIVHKVKDTWTREEHCTDMQYYMEYCQMNGYVTPMKWLDELKHYK